MKQILLLSDTHGFLDLKIKKYAEKADEIWHAGDIGKMIILERLEAIKPVRAVYGNIDNHKIRKRVPEILNFKCEGVKVLMIHIAGYPGYYNSRVKNLIKLKQPKLFICGHSHILKIMQDKKNETPNFVTVLGKDKALQKALEVSNKAINSIQKFKYGTENLVSLAKYTVNRDK